MLNLGKGALSSDFLEAKVVSKVAGFGFDDFSETMGVESSLKKTIWSETAHQVELIPLL